MAQMHVHQAQCPQTFTQRSRITPADHHRRDAHLLQQLQPLPVQRVEALERLAGFGKIKTAIGEDTIHIQKHRADTLCLQQQFGCKADRGCHDLAGLFR